MWSFWCIFNSRRWESDFRTLEVDWSKTMYNSNCFMDNNYGKNEINECTVCLSHRFICIFLSTFPSFASPFYFLHISSLTICTYQFACQISDAQRHLRIGGRKKGGGPTWVYFSNVFIRRDPSIAHLIEEIQNSTLLPHALYRGVYSLWCVADTAASSDSVSRPLLRLSQGQAVHSLAGHCQYMSLATFCRYRVPFS